MKQGLTSGYTYLIIIIIRPFYCLVNSIKGGNGKAGAVCSGLRCSG